MKINLPSIFGMNKSIPKSIIIQLYNHSTVSRSLMMPQILTRLFANIILKSALYSTEGVSNCHIHVFVCVVEIRCTSCDNLLARNRNINSNSKHISLPVSTGCKLNHYAAAYDPFAELFELFHFLLDNRNDCI